MKMQNRIVVRVIAWWCLAMNMKLSLVMSCTGSCSKVFNTKDELLTAILVYTGPTGPNGDINQWCFPTVTDLSNLLNDQSTFNYDIGCWDVSRVTNMEGMFFNATVFNQNIGSWDVSRVTDMSSMFYYATAFNQNIGSWDVSRVTSMEFMFTGAATFNQNIGSWDVSRVTRMVFMFGFADAFNQNIVSWSVSRVTSMNAMFYSAPAFNQNVGQWNVSRVTNMFRMFSYAEAFNQNIGQWDVSRVTNMSRMFAFTYFNQNIGSWNVSRVTDMDSMFQRAIDFNQDISSWDVSSVTDMFAMFDQATTFDQNLCAWGPKMSGRTVSVTDMFDKTSCADQSSPILSANPVAPLCAQVCIMVVKNPTKAPMQALIPTRLAPVRVPLPTPVRLPTNRTIDVFPGENSFAQIVNNAISGDTIIVHQGDHLISDTINISVDGTESSPVVIRRAVGEMRPRILRSSIVALQNTINIVGATYLTIQGLEILSNGGEGIKIYSGDGTRNNKFIFLNDLVIHQVAVGINAQTNIDQLQIRKSRIYDTSNGQGINLGCRDGTCVVTNSIIERNWIHDTRSTVSDQGNGIELNQNSNGNIIRNNVIYDTDSSGLFVSGAGTGAVNRIEGNAMWNCKKAGIQATADAIIQNNLVLNSNCGLISSAQNSINPRNLRIVHNTLLGHLACLDIQSWNGQSDIVFANNAVYCKTDTMNIQGGTEFVQISGNVFFPDAAAFPSGSFVLGSGITLDFENNDSDSLNAYPTSNSPLRTAANAEYAAAIDFDETERLKFLPVDVGAYEWQVLGRKWNVSSGFKPDRVIVGGGTPAPITNRPVKSPTAAPTRRSLVCRIFILRLFFSRRCR